MRESARNAPHPRSKVDMLVMTPLIQPTEYQIHSDFFSFFFVIHETNKLLGDSYARINRLTENEIVYPLVTW